MQIRLVTKMRDNMQKGVFQEVTLIQGDIWLLIQYLISNGEIQFEPQSNLHLYVDDVEIPKPEEMDDDT